MDEDEIDRLLAQLGLELPDAEDEGETAARFVEGWEEFGGWDAEE